MKLSTLFAAAAIFAVAIAPSHAQTRKTIVEVADGAGIFTTLLAAATAAGLADELDEVYGLTVFAPTDEAFEALPPGTVDELLKPENQQTLRAIIAYHILPRTVRSRQISLRPRLAETLNGCERVRTDRNRNGHVTVDDARVVKADIRARNGIIHVIDKVLLPARNCP